MSNERDDRDPSASGLIADAHSFPFNCILHLASSSPCSLSGLAVDSHIIPLPSHVHDRVPEQAIACSVGLIKSCLIHWMTCLNRSLLCSCARGHSVDPKLVTAPGNYGYLCATQSET